MPREARRNSLSNVYHCMLRGNNQQDIFFEDKDYLEFQDIIKKNKESLFVSIIFLCSNAKSYSFRN